MSRKEKLKLMLEQFQRAKKILWNGHRRNKGGHNREYICHAIDHSLYPGTYEVAKACKKLVMDGLNQGHLYCFTYVDWLYKNHNLVNPSKVYVQQCRHAYVDAIIKKIEEELYA